VRISELNVNPLNTKLNPICHLLALLGAHRILHVSRIRVKQVIFIHQFWTVRYFYLSCSRVTAGEQHSLPSLLLLLSGVNCGQKLGTKARDETRMILK
jgi:hypothetical protein